MPRKLTQEEFIEKVKAVHGESRYDLSKVQYVGVDKKVEVICPEHGNWWATPANLFNGKGCPKCGVQKRSKTRKITQEEFEKRVRKIHGQKYDLRNTRYVGVHEKVEVVCPKHGCWWVTPDNLFHGHGCPKCGDESVSRKRLFSQQQFIEKVHAVHGKNRYDLSRAKYISSVKKVEIVCPEHGSWWVIPYSLFIGKGCRKCSGYAKLTQEEFEKRIKEVFGSKADCSKVVYSGVHVDVTIRCIEHDIEFNASPNNLFMGKWNCPKCFNSWTSKGEEVIYNYLCSLGQNLTILRNVRDVIPPKEVDIYIPEKSLAIEYNGYYYHNDYRKDRNYHRDKYLACKEKGIHLIQILDLVWDARQKQVKSLLANVIGACDDVRKINARSCEVRQVNVGDLRDFFNANHIQGHCRTGNLSLALVFEGEIVAGIVFGKGTNRRGKARIGREGEWTLSRYATNCVVRGGFQKLLKHGRDLIGWEHDIISFSMLDFFSGETYKAAGFELDAEIGPDYQVYHPRNGLRPKSHWQRRMIPKRLQEIGWEGGFDPETDPRTEWQVEDEVGAVRVWDSGKIRWRLRGVDK